MINNTAKNIAQKDVNEIVEKVGMIYPEGSGVIMTIADIWREEGIRKGEAQAVRKMAREMLTKGFTVELVAEITHLNINEVKKMKEQQEN